MRAAIVLFTALIIVSGCGKKVEEAPPPGEFTGKVVTTYEEALQSAKAENKPILIVAYQGNADMIDRNLLHDGAVRSRGSKFITAKLDAATQSDAMSKLGVKHYPDMMILHPDGTEAWHMGSRIAFPGEVAQAIDNATGGGKK